MRVTVQDVRAAGLCLGVRTRRFFRHHDLDFGAFLRDGIEAERLLATGDAMALRAVEAARERHHG